MNIIGYYQDQLQRYTLEQLRFRAPEQSWTIGQLYDHVISVALEFFSHIRTCAASTEVQPEGKTEIGEEVFRNMQYPPIKIKLPDAPEFVPRNPESKESIAAGLQYVQSLLADWRKQVFLINPGYKARHAGLGWLNAHEWYQLIDMHSRHHLRQKAELDQELEKYLV